MKKHKTIFNLLFFLSIGFTILHLIFVVISNTMSIGIESVLLNVIPYGLPILVFSSTSRTCRTDKPRWRKAGFIMMTLFALSFLAMSAHVTLAFFFSKEAFINIYFNIPILYAIPMILFALLWVAMKKAPEKRAGEKTRVGKFLSALPVLVLIAMLVHCGVVSAIEIYRQVSGPLTTSFPWWVLPLLIAFWYIVALALALVVRGIYNFVQKRKNA